MNRSVRLSLALLAALAPACKLAPTYERPKAGLPEAYAGQAPAPGAASFADVAWFDLFQDPVLKELVRIAIDQNADLRIAANRVLQTEVQVGIARSYRSPTVTSGPGASRGVDAGARALQGANAAPGDQYVVNMGVSYELDFWGRLRSQTDVARAQFLASQENRNLVLQTLVTGLAQAYFQLRELDAELDVARKTLDSREGSLRLVKLRHIPGLIFAGIGTISDALGWGSRATKKVLQEIIDAGMVLIDDSERMLFLPNAIRYNLPDNPNIILGWRKPWSEIPEGNFRNSIHNIILPSIKAKGPSFLGAFLSSCPLGNPSPNGSRNPSPNCSVDPSPNGPGNPTRNPLADPSGNQITDIGDQLTASNAVVVMGASPGGTGDTREELRTDPEISSTSIRDSATTSSTAPPVTSPHVPLPPPPGPIAQPRMQGIPARGPECPSDTNGGLDDGAEPADFEEIANEPDFGIQAEAHGVLLSYQQRVTALAPGLFTAWNQGHPADPPLSLDEFGHIDPDDEGKGARLFRRLCDLLATRPEAGEHLQAIFSSFEKNHFAWGLNEKGTAYSLGFLLSNVQNLERYAEAAVAASKRTPRPANSSKPKAASHRHDRAAADEAYRQAAASQRNPSLGLNRTSLDVLSSK